MELMEVHGFANPNPDQAKFNADLHDELLRHQTVKQSCYHAAWAGGCQVSQPDCMDDAIEHAASVALDGKLRYSGKKAESKNEGEEGERPVRQKSEVCFHDSYSSPSLRYTDRGRHAEGLRETFDLEPGV